MNSSNIKKTPTSKMLSGRWWLTLSAGVAFLIFVITICQILYLRRDILTGSELVSIINVLLLIVSNVMTFYFTKNRDDMNQERKDIASFISNQIDKPKTE